MQFFRYLYHNVPDLSPMWHSAEFLCALAAAVFPFNIRPYSEMVRLKLFFFPEIILKASFSSLPVTPGKYSNVSSLTPSSVKI